MTLDFGSQIVVIGAGGFLGQSLYQYLLDKKKPFLFISRSLMASKNISNNSKFHLVEVMQLCIFIVI